MSSPASPSSIQNNDKEERNRFQNKGLQLWESNRQQWCHKKTAEQLPQRQATSLNVDEIIDVIFTHTQMAEPRFFPQPVPLPQMVDILQDLWEAEGLDA
jgi:hypothetical protein